MEALGHALAGVVGEIVDNAPGAAKATDAKRG